MADSILTNSILRDTLALGSGNLIMMQAKFPRRDYSEDTTTSGPSAKLPTNTDAVVFIRVYGNGGGSDAVDNTSEGQWMIDNHEYKIINASSKNRYFSVTRNNLALTSRAVIAGTAGSWYYEATLILGCFLNP